VMLVRVTCADLVVIKGGPSKQITVSDMFPQTARVHRGTRPVLILGFGFTNKHLRMMTRTDALCLWHETWSIRNPVTARRGRYPTALQNGLGRGWPLVIQIALKFVVGSPLSSGFSCKWNRTRSPSARFFSVRTNDVHVKSSQSRHPGSVVAGDQIG
jgi:hypothetical protein